MPQIRFYLFQHCLCQSQAILTALSQRFASARPVYTPRAAWASVNAAQLASVQSVWLSTIRMVLGMKLGHLGVSVNLFGTRLLLSNGNLSCLLLTLNRTLQRLLSVLFMHSAVQFIPSPISALLPVRNLIFNLLCCLLRTCFSLQSSLILYAPAKPAQIYVLIGRMPPRLVLMVSNTFWLSWIKARSTLLLIIPKRVLIPSICSLITSLLPNVYPNSSASMALKNLSVLK